jgi:hypothetical protein
MTLLQLASHSYGSIFYRIRPQLTTAGLYWNPIGLYKHSPHPHYHAWFETDYQKGIRNNHFPPGMFFFGNSRLLTGDEEGAVLSAMHLRATSIIEGWWYYIGSMGYRS